jgi:hypothetical protein
MVCTCASASLKRDGLVRIGAAATPPGKPLRTSHSRRRPHAPHGKPSGDFRRRDLHPADLDLEPARRPRRRQSAGWVVGNEPYVSLHFLGTDHYAK